MHKKLFIIVILTLLFIFTLTKKIIKFEFPTFKVVLDPGHGGVNIDPRSKHGDRYDLISGKYLDIFKPGASYRNLREHIIVFDISKKVMKILKLCGPKGNYKKFKKIINKYTDVEPERINIISSMSRGKSIDENGNYNGKDPNSGFRMFDYPDKDGDIQPGRISRINALRPHLVVSLHCATRSSKTFNGMSPVVIPSHGFLRKGLLYLQNRQSSENYFDKSSVEYWFCESTKRTPFKWFLNDASLYFTGFPLNNDLTVNLKKFKGYRYNMIKWAYSDPAGWEKTAKHHKNETKYSSDYKNYKPEGKFWDRERLKFEKFRRERGIEGYGGDNAYASYEIIRYILLALHKKGHRHRKLKPNNSYFSVWIMPLHLNAINAFIELGYLDMKIYRHTLTKKQNEIAEGIAVGIYSLLSGLKIKNKKFKYSPKGKKIDLKKYNITKEVSYFDAVVD